MTDLRQSKPELHPRDGLVSPGRTLYEAWCDAPGSDREHYWLMMNSGDKQAWERLAERLEAASLPLAQALRLIRDTTTGFASRHAAATLERCGIEDPEDDCAVF